jgi:dihydrofolate reductase
MTRVVYNTACSIDGFLADEHDDLQWLFDVPGAADAEADFAGFLAGIGVIVMGSTTYRWLLEHESLLDHPERWSLMYGTRATWVLSTRELATIPGADIRLASGSVGDQWPAMAAAAGDRDVWVVGGGDLAGQFADAGLLDEIRLSVAPVALGGGRPSLPRRIGAERLRLRSARAAGQFAELVYDVVTV